MGAYGYGLPSYAGYHGLGYSGYTGYPYSYGAYPYSYGLGYSHYAAPAVMRGKVAMKEVEEVMAGMQNKISDNFVPWIPHNTMTAACHVPPTGLEKSGTVIANSTAISHLIYRISSRFSALFKRKAFVHNYINEGLDEMEFTEAASNIDDLICEYQACQDATADIIDDEEIEP